MAVKAGDIWQVCIPAQGLGFPLRRRHSHASGYPRRQGLEFAVTAAFGATAAYLPINSKTAQKRQI